MGAAVPETVLKTIETRRLLEDRRAVVVGVSGGPDSVCLLHVLANLRERFGFALTAAHLNHNLRGAESDADAAYVKELCGRLGVPLALRSADVAKAARDRKVSLETAGREERYRFFREVAKGMDGAAIAVGHNRDDQAETVLMNAIRGSGLEGLTGMAYRNGDVIRPLLDVPRADIEAYCAANGLAPRTDKTNADPSFTRNRVRTAVLPAIDAIPGTDVRRALPRMAGILAEDADYLRAAALEAADRILTAEADGGIALDAAGFRPLHPALARRVARVALERLRGGLADVDALHTDRVARLAARGRTGARLELPGGVTARREHGRVVLTLSGDGAHDDGSSGEAASGPQASGSGGIALPPGGGTVRFGGWTFRATIRKAGDAPPLSEIRKAAASGLIQHFDADKLGNDARIRARLPGDVFRPLNGRGSKKLNDRLTDLKVPLRERDRPFLLASGGEIAWIIGYNVGDVFKVTEKTKNVLTMEVAKSEDG